MTTHKAMDVAVAFLEMAKAVGDTSLSNMKLLKLLYYAQGLTAAAFHRQLFTEDIEAWELGPVVREVWGQFKSFGDRPITTWPKPPTASALTAADLQTIKLIYSTYGKQSATKLSDWTHCEIPWLTKQHQGGTITFSALRSFFSQPRIAASKEGEPQMLCRLSSQYTLGIVEITDMVHALGRDWTAERVVEHLESIHVERPPSLVGLNKFRRADALRNLDRARKAPRKSASHETLRREAKADIRLGI